MEGLIDKKSVSVGDLEHGLPSLKNRSKEELQRMLDVYQTSEHSDSIVTDLITNELLLREGK